MFETAVHAISERGKEAVGRARVGSTQHQALPTWELMDMFPKFTSADPFGRAKPTLPDNLSTIRGATVLPVVAFRNSNI
jgi:hypothetical protein